ncbi:hypothetical protein EMCRGX_G010618 [Ephydatia muelleri]
MTISKGSNFSSCYPVNNTDRGTAEDTGHIKEIDCSRTEKSVVVQSDSRSHALYDGIAQEVQCCTSNEDSSSDEDTESAPYDGTANDETTEEVQCCTSSEDSASDEDTESAPYDGSVHSSAIVVKCKPCKINFIITMTLGWFSKSQYEHICLCCGIAVECHLYQEPGMETAQVHLGTGCNIDKFLQIVHYCTTAKEIVATISSGRLLLITLCH